MMTTKRWTPRNHAVSGLFVFVLLVVFALLCLTTVFLSVRSYMGVTQDVSAYAEERVLTGYLRGKVRAADTAGAVSLRQEDTGTVLCLRQEDWETRIFAYDGNLMEQLFLVRTMERLLQEQHSELIITMVMRTLQVLI